MVLSLLAAASSRLACAATNYAITDLGTLAPSAVPGASYAYGISGTGQVVGVAQNATGAYHAFLYANGVMTDLGTLGGAASTAYAINGAGQILGIADTGNDTHAFLYAAGQLSDLGPGMTSLPAANNAGAPGSRMALNGGGQFIWNTSVLASYSGGTVTQSDLRTALGGNPTIYALNATGQLAGVGSAAGNSNGAFFYSSPNVTALTSLWVQQGGAANSGYNSTTPMALNNTGLVVGWSYANVGGTGVEHAFSWSAGTMTDLGTPTGWTQIRPAAVNGSGVVVGYGVSSGAGQPSGTFAFVYSGGAMTNLNSLAGSTGWTLTYATAVNDAGQIAGWGTNPQGLQRAFLLTPATGAAPTITVQPQSQNTKTGATIVLSVTATGTPSPTYQWLKAGVTIVGATNRTLTLAGLKSTDGGNYTVAVSNSAGSVLSSAAVVSVALPNPSTFYRVTDLGSLAPPALAGTSYAYGINNAGQVVGVADTDLGQHHAFLYANGAMTDLGTLGGAASTAYAINNNGQIVGVSDTGSNQHAFFYTGGQMKDLTELTSLPTSDGRGSPMARMALNTAGQFVWNTAALVSYVNGSLTVTDTNPQVRGSLAAINSAGTAVGNNNINGGGFLYGSGSVTAIGSLWALEGGVINGYNYSQPFAINDNGQVTGWSYAYVNGTAVRRAFLYSGGQLSDLGLPPGWDSIDPVAISNNGVVVGSGHSSAAGQPSGTFAFVYNNGVMADLNTVTGSTGWTFSYATSVNDNGQIVGWGSNPQGFTRAFLLTPGAASAPVISVQPVTQTTKAGATITLSVTASGTPSPTYQWLKNSVAIVGATNSSLTLAGLRATDGGNYTVVVTNQVGTVTSNAATVSVALPNPSVFYSVTDLGNLAPPALAGTSYAFAINNAGQVVGVADTATGRRHAFLWSGGTMTDLGTTGGVAGESTAYSINNASPAQILGVSDSPAGPHAFIQPVGGARADLTGLTSLPSTDGRNYTFPRMVLNAAGQFVWLTRSIASYDSGSLTLMDTLPTVNGTLYWINAAGSAVGNGSVVGYGYIYNANGTFATIGSLWAMQGGVANSYHSSYPSAINDNGQVTGWSYANVNGTAVRHVFLYSGGQLSDLGLPPGWDTIDPVAINNGGVVVGSGHSGAAGQPTGTFAFVYSNGVMADLNTLTGSTGWTFYYATGVNDSGKIVGWGVNPQGFTRAFLLTPGAAAAPTIAVQPANQNTKVGATVALSVTASGTPSPTYQWLKNNVAIVGATNSSLTLAGLRSTDGGSYTVAVTNQAGTVTSNAAVVSVASVTPTVFYSITDLGNLASSALAGSSYAYSINNAGQVVGVADTATGRHHAFLWSGGTMTDLGTTAGVLGDSTAYSINNASPAQIIGVSDTPGPQRAFIQTVGGGRVDLSGLSSLPPSDGRSNTYTRMVLNAAGQFVWGTGAVANYVNGSLTLTDTTQVVSGTVRSINAVGNAAGYGNVSHSAYIYDDNGTYTTIGSLWGMQGGIANSYNSSYPWAINDSDQVTGWSYANMPGGVVRHAFLYSGGQLTDLGLPPGWDFIDPVAINNSGVVVGSGHSSAAGQPSGTFAFVCSNGVMADLTTLTGNTGWTLYYATGVNDSGKIVGWGLNPQGFNRAFLLTPGPLTAPVIAVQPLSQTAKSGGTVTLSVTASGTPSPTYQWQKNGTPLVGATSSTLTLAGLKSTDAGSYTVVVTNQVSSATSAAATITVTAAPTPITYAITDLGTLGGVGSSYAYGINNAGQVVGVADLTVNSTVRHHAFLWSGGTMTDLGTTGGVTGDSTAYSINNATPAQILGVSDTASSQHAFIQPVGGTRVDLTGLTGLPSSDGRSYTYPRMVLNSAGQFVWRTGAIAGYANGSLTVTDTSAVVNGTLYWINAGGSAAGYGNVLGAGYVYNSNGTFATLGSLWPLEGGTANGYYSSYPAAINDSGQITGWSYASQNGSPVRRAFLYSAGQIIDVGLPSGWDYVDPVAINNSGVIVGSGYSSVTGQPAGTFAFVYSNGAMTNLNSLIGSASSSWTLYYATGVNDNGQIIGWGLIGTQNHAFLLTPPTGAPAISVQPQSQVAGVGGSLTFAVTAGGSPAPTYQWQKNGNSITGATTANFTLASVQLTDAANYTVVVSNSAGSVTSAIAALGVTPTPALPAITTQPQSTTVVAGNAVVITVAASGTPAPGFQWKKNGTPITGATGASLVLENTQAADAGTYSVVASNAAGSATSNTVTLTVNVPPAIATQPAGAEVVAGGSITFTVVATGSPAPTYRWQKNGADISGATNASLSLANVQNSDTAAYTVIVSNVAGTLTSNAAMLTVVAPVAAPSILVQPLNQTANAGATATFSISASGSPTLTFQWQRQAAGTSGFVPVPNGGGYNGANTAILTISGVAGAMRGDQFRCVVANGITPNATSNAATLTVNAAPLFTSASATTFRVGTAGTFTLTTSGFPASTFAVTGGALPPWATLNAATGVLSGTPTSTTGSPFTFTLTASNGTAPDATQVFTLTVNLAIAPDIVVQGKGVAIVPGRTSATTVDDTDFGSVGLGASAQHTFTIRNNGNAPLNLSGSPLVVRSGTNAADFTVTQPTASSIAAGQTLTFSVAFVPTAAGSRSAQITLTSDDPNKPTYAIYLAGVGAAAPFATRILPAFYVAGQDVTVSITATPAGTASNYAVQDGYPAGWTLKSMGTGGEHDSANKLVKFGPFFDAQQRTLTYVVTAPANATGTVAFSGVASVDGGNTVIGGTGSLSKATLHPADNNPADSSIAIGEVTAYGAAWKRGDTWVIDPNPIPISYVTRAGFLWKGGELYHVDPAVTTAPLWWVNGAQALSPLAVPVADDSTSILAREQATTAGSTSVRSISGGTVTVAVTPDASVGVYAVEEVVAAGLTVSGINNSGSFDSVNRKVKWGPYFDNTARSLAYTVSGADGTYPISGVASFDGANVTTTGSTQLTLVAVAAPTITAQPANKSVASGQSTTFSITATGSPAPTYQWQRQPAGTTGFSTLANGGAYGGVTTATLTITGATVAMNGDQFRCVVANGIAPDATSSAATLAVGIAPQFTSGSSATFTVGTAGSFTFTATGSTPITFSVTSGTLPAGVTLNSSTGVLSGTPSSATGTPFVVTISATNAFAVSAQSFTLNVQAAPALTTQPANQTVVAGQNASFTVAATGTPAPGYQWQRQAAGGSGFTNVTNGGAYSGATTATLTITSATGAMSGDQFRVVVSNGVTPDATSSAATLTVNVPPVFTSAATATFVVGVANSFTVTASGRPAPTFSVTSGTLPAWATFNGTTGVLSGTPPNTTGSPFSFTFTANNTISPNATQAFTLTVQAATVPSITTQPVGQNVASGATATFTVVATGTPQLTYQWRKDGVAIAGATAATYTIVNAQTTDSGNYTVIVGNAAGSVTSAGASLGVIPPNTTATHATGSGYLPGSTITVTNTLTYTGTATALGWQVLLPAGWSYLSGGGSEGDTKPGAGTIDLLEWAWTTPPPSPVTFTYTLNVPADQTGDKQIAALVIMRFQGASGPVQFTAKPDPLVVSQLTNHAADTNLDFRMSLLELTRVIELYNTRNGNSRTGAYKVQDGTEDGFAPDPTRTNTTVVSLTKYHSSDYLAPRDGKISLLELTRMIELYNYRSGTTRTGQYHVQPGTEDGFAPGP